MADNYFVRKIEYKRQPDIAGRELELWLVIEIMLKSLGAQDEVELAKRRFLSQYGFSEYEPSEIEEEVVMSILGQFQENTEVVLSPKKISESINPEAFLEKDTPKQRAAKVGWAIKKFNLASEKKAENQDGIC